jgi:hypothetical protein
MFCVHLGGEPRPHCAEHVLSLADVLLLPCDVIEHVLGVIGALLLPCDVIEHVLAVIGALLLPCYVQNTFWQ